MPCLTGVGLLSKIMSHQTRKNVPIIMMSSHDSMGLGFKCLSKGAVDFLLKPIRKNELKNLWQHVWRRCHSSSGSGSESGTQTQKPIKSKSIERSSNNNGSNNGSNDEVVTVGVPLRVHGQNKLLKLAVPQPLSLPYLYRCYMLNKSFWDIIFVHRINCQHKVYYVDNFCHYCFCMNKLYTFS